MVLAVELEAVGQDLAFVGGVDAFKGVEAHGPDLDRPAAADDFVVEGHADAGDPLLDGGKGRGQVAGGVGEGGADGQLGAGEDHGLFQVLEHEGQHGGGVGHGVRAVGDDHAVVVREGFVDAAGDELPLLSLDVGAVQVQDVFAVDAVVAAQVVHLPEELRRGFLRGKAVGAGGGGDGPAGGEKKDVFHGDSFRYRAFRFRRRRGGKRR